MPKEGQKTETALKFVTCPWAQMVNITLADCKPCQFHKGIRDVVTQQFTAGEKVPLKIGEQVVCHFPQAINVQCVEKAVNETIPPEIENILDGTASMEDIEKINGQG